MPGRGPPGHGRRLRPHVQRGWAKALPGPLRVRWLRPGAGGLLLPGAGRWANGWHCWLLLASLPSTTGQRTGGVRCGRRARTGSPSGRTAGARRARGKRTARVPTTVASRGTPGTASAAPPRASFVASPCHRVCAIPKWARLNECSLEGGCASRLSAWGWVGNGCQQFVFTGCGGNDNRFESAAECERFCRPKVGQGAAAGDQLGPRSDDPGLVALGVSLAGPPVPGPPHTCSTVPGLNRRGVA